MEQCPEVAWWAACSYDQGVGGQVRTHTCAPQTRPSSLPPRSQVLGLCGLLIQLSQGLDLNFQNGKCKWFPYKWLSGVHNTH